MCESKEYLLFYKQSCLFLIITIIVIFLSSCSSSSKTEETPPFVDPVPNTETQTVSETLPALDLPMTPEQIYEYASAATVEITAIGDGFISTGTGFFCDSDAYLITNYHVIDGASEAYITISDGGRYDITGYLGYDESLDIALLETTYSPKTILSSCSETIHTGEAVYTIGSSEGLTASFSSGIVSMSNRVLDGQSFIQITAQISHGNSGGPVLNSAGEVIGISTATIESGQNLNFAIPIYQIKDVSIDTPQSLADAETVRHFDEAYKTLNALLIDCGDYIKDESGAVLYDYFYVDPFFEYTIELRAYSDHIFALWKPFVIGTEEYAYLALPKSGEIGLVVSVSLDDTLYTGVKRCTPSDISITDPPLLFDINTSVSEGDTGSLDFWTRRSINNRMEHYVSNLFRGMDEALENIGFPYELTYFEFEE